MSAAQHRRVDQVLHMVDALLARHSEPVREAMLFEIARRMLDRGAFSDPTECRRFAAIEQLLHAAFVANDGDETRVRALIDATATCARIRYVVSKETLQLDLDTRDME